VTGALGMSGDPSQPLADWTSPPAGVREAALPYLRYAAIVGFACDRLKRTAVLELLPCTEEGSPEPPLLFVLRDVSSTRAVTHELWPGGLVAAPDASAEDRMRAVAEFKAKCTEVSVAWSVCEDALASGAFAVIDAGWISDANVVALRFDVVDGKTRGYTVFLRCGGADVTSADGTPLSLAKL
jgi:hypothetical protein